MRAEESRRHWREVTSRLRVKWWWNSESIKHCLLNKLYDTRRPLLIEQRPHRKISTWIYLSLWLSCKNYLLLRRLFFFCCTGSWTSSICHVLCPPSPIWTVPSPRTSSESDLPTSRALHLLHVEAKCFTKQRTNCQLRHKRAIPK